MSMLDAAESNLDFNQYDYRNKRSRNTKKTHISCLSIMFWDGPCKIYVKQTQSFEMKWYKNQAIYLYTVYVQINCIWKIQ